MEESKIIELSNAELEDAWSYASKSVENHFDRMHYDLIDRVEKIYCGKVAELAVAKALGIKYNFVFHPHTDDGYLLRVER